MGGVRGCIVSFHWLRQESVCEAGKTAVYTNNQIGLIHVGLISMRGVCVCGVCGVGLSRP